MTAFDGLFFSPISTGPVLSGRFETPPETRALPRLRVYVDESGDRNFGATRGSDWFTMTAVMVPEEGDRDFRFVIGGLKYEFGLAPTAMLHWKDHFRTRHKGRREYAATRLAAIPHVQLVHVLLHKPSIDANAHMRSSPAGAYNYVTKLLLERVAQAARAWPGGPRLALVRLGVVGGVDHDVTSDYMHHVASRARPTDQVVIPWDHLSWPLRWSQTGQFDGLQVADLYSGMLFAALTGKSAEPLLLCGHQNRRSPFGSRPLLRYGVKVVPDSGTSVLIGHPWWLQLVERRDP